MVGTESSAPTNFTVQRYVAINTRSVHNLYDHINNFTQRRVTQFLGHRVTVPELGCLWSLSQRLSMFTTSVWQQQYAN